MIAHNYCVLSLPSPRIACTGTQGRRRVSGGNPTFPDGHEPHVKAIVFVRFSPLALVIFDSPGP